LFPVLIKIEIISSDHSQIYSIEHKLYVLGFSKDEFPNEHEVHLRFLSLLGILRLWFKGEPSQDFSA
jgi:hypothetical protein